MAPILLVVGGAKVELAQALVPCEDRCHVTKLNEIYRHPGAAVRLQKYRPCCYNLGLLRPAMQTSRTTDGNQQRRNNE